MTRKRLHFNYLWSLGLQLDAQGGGADWQRYRAMAHTPPPGFFWLFAIRELVSNKPCVILAASWWVSGDGKCRDETRCENILRKRVQHTYIRTHLL